MLQRHFTNVVWREDNVLTLLTNPFNRFQVNRGLASRDSQSQNKYRVNGNISILHDMMVSVVCFICLEPTTHADAIVQAITTIHSQ